MDGNAFVYSVTVGALETISLPMLMGSDSLYNAVVNFGDETGDKMVSAYADPDRQHEYVLAGTYDITIVGTWDYIIFADSPNSIVELKNFGMAKIGQSSFFNCVNFSTISATDSPDVFSNALTTCFAGCSSLDFNASILSLSSVISVSQMFKDCTSFNNSGQTLTWTDSNSVTNFGLLFFGCSIFNQQMNIDTSSGTLFNEMFRECTLFNQDVSGLNYTSATDFRQMFQLAFAFNNGGVALNMGATTNLTECLQMFILASSFNQPVTMDTSGVTDMSSMFQQATIYNQPITFDTSGVTNMNFMFLTTTAMDQDLSSMDITSLTTAISMLQNTTMSIANYDALLIGWESQIEQPNVPFHGGNANYNNSPAAAGVARAALVANGWTITDGGGV